MASRLPSEDMAHPLHALRGLTYLSGLSVVHSGALSLKVWVLQRIRLISVTYFNPTRSSADELLPNISSKGVYTIPGATEFTLIPLDAYMIPVTLEK